jgi:hypothetical protein
MRPVALFVLVAAVVAIGPFGSAGAARKARDQFWTRPEFQQLEVDRIALFPVTSYDNNIQNENMIEASLGQAFKSTGYRWISGTSTREMMRARSGGDSLLKALRAGILANAKLDSASAPVLMAMLRCDAVLTVRMDQFERHEPEWNVAGKPYTTVQLKAALVDSLGRTLWTASGSETGEGPYYDPGANPVSVKDTGLERKPVSAQGGAPSFREVLTLLFTRWAEQFPARPVAPAPADTAAKPR